MNADKRPNLFIVGVAKAGTTSLHSRLATHPRVFMSTPKEPQFLAAPQATPEAEYALNAVRDEATYLELFAEAEEPVRGESSTTNWWRPETAARIDAFSPGSIAIVLLRDPVERAFSHYLNDVRDGFESRPFPETLPDARPGAEALRWGDPDIRVELGFYAERLLAYREVFGDRLIVLFAEDFFIGPETQASTILDLLDLDPAFPTGPSNDSGTNAHRVPRNQIARQVLRSSKVRRAVRILLPAKLRERGYESLMRKESRPQIDPRSSDHLRRLYAADSARLATMINRPLPWLHPMHERNAGSG